MHTPLDGKQDAYPTHYFIHELWYYGRCLPAAANLPGSPLMPFLRLLVACCITCVMPLQLSAEELALKLRYQQPVAKGADRFHRVVRDETWQSTQTAVIVCDMWDAHHCVNAVRRGAELAPRIDAFVSELRQRGAVVIHAPSDCMDHYAQHPARLRAQATKRVQSLPDHIESWCDQIPSEEAAAYPVDQSAGGEDDDPEEHRLWAARLQASGRNPKAPWRAQTSHIAIDAQRDYVSDSGPEIWSILEDRAVSNVILVGVHTNMCVLGRPFGLRRLTLGGKHAVLARDLTDTMIDPRAWPYANHFTGTDLIVSHIERYVCPTITSDQVVGGQEFRFSADDRVRLAMLIGEDEYHTENTLPAFAAKHLSQHFSVSTYYADESEPSKFVGIEQIAAADALLISVRRRALPECDLQVVRQFVRSGKPMLGIRTASHAFALRNQPSPAGADQWPEFDAEVWGGNYRGHYSNNIPAALADFTSSHPIAVAAGLTDDFKPGGSLYQTTPLLAGTDVLLLGSVPGEEPAQPLAWTFVRNDGGRSFYTSLGHVDDFAQSQFEALLAAGIHWACGVPLPTLADVQAQSARYHKGHGRQH